jgi:hypothetical protein
MRYFTHHLVSAANYWIKETPKERLEAERRMTAAIKGVSKTISLF